MKPCLNDRGPGDLATLIPETQEHGASWVQATSLKSPLAGGGGAVHPADDNALLETAGTTGEISETDSCAKELI